MGANCTLTSMSVWKDYRPMQNKLAEAQRKELDLNDQLQLYHDQLEATKVLYCSSGNNSVCMRACVCVVIKLAAIHMNVAHFC